MRGRPARSYGPVAEALVQAAGQGPAAVKDLAARAQVGFGVARYTASRLLAARALVVVAPGRPRVLGVPAPGSSVHEALHSLSAALHGGGQQAALFAEQ
jgi:hypothetical protein